MLFVATAGANFHFAGIDLDEASAMASLCRPAQNKGLEEQPQVLSSSDVSGSPNTFLFYDLYSSQFLHF